MTDPDLRALEEPGDVLAAELALGLLEGEDRALALRRQLAEPDFAREVEHWRAHFAALFADTPSRTVGDHLYERVETRLDRPASEVAPMTRTTPGFWRPLAMASSLAAASLAGVLLLGSRPQRAPTPVIVAAAPASAPMMIAALAHDGGSPFAAVYDPAAKMVKMPGKMPIPAGRSAQLWAIAPGQPPQPLGLFHVVGNSVVAEAKTSVAIPAGTTLAISFEPLGGSPTGLPTGPVVASGTLGSV